MRNIINESGGIEATLEWMEWDVPLTVYAINNGTFIYKEYWCSRMMDEMSCDIRIE